MTLLLKLSLPILFLAVTSGIAAVMIAARPEAKFIPPPPPTLLVEVAQIERQPITHTI